MIKLFQATLLVFASIQLFASNEWLYYKHFPWVYDHKSKEWMYFSGSADGGIYVWRQSTKGGLNLKLIIVMVKIVKFRRNLQVQVILHPLNLNLANDMNLFGETRNFGWGVLLMKLTTIRWL